MGLTVWQVSLGGLPAASSWALYAPYIDITFMRDVLTYNLSRAIGMWAPRTQFIELFVVEDGQAPQATQPCRSVEGT